MANGWKNERKEKQRTVIRQWQPWQHSTGAKSSAGKQKVSRNAYKGGVRPQLRELAKLLREQQKILHNVA
jgi:hypothetical protein